MSDREDFEKWAKDGFQLGKGCDGYLSAFTSSAFRAWQARQPEIDALKEKLESREAQMETVGSIERDLRNELARLKAENERLRKDAERWGFCRDNKNFRYFRNSGVWEILKQNRGALIEGRATTYQDAVDAAIAAMKEEK